MQGPGFGWLLSSLQVVLWVISLGGGLLLVRGEGGGVAKEFPW